MALPGIDGICDYDSPYRAYADEEAPDIDCQYNIYWQLNGEVYCEYFTIYEDSDIDKQFKKTLTFAKEHDALIMYREPDGAYFNPKTGEEIRTPNCGMYCKHYYDQPHQPYENNFIGIETYELPF